MIQSKNTQKNPEIWKGKGEREMRGIDETKCVSWYEWMKVVTPFPNWEEFDSEREHNMTEHTVTYLLSSRDDVVIREVGGFCVKVLHVNSCFYTFDCSATLVLSFPHGSMLSLQVINPFRTFCFVCVYIKNLRLQNWSARSCSPVPGDHFALACDALGSNGLSFIKPNGLKYVF